MLNIQFKKITLHNFGSYSHAEVNLENRGFCLVLGKNNCAKDNAESNGSGKSFIWSGICYALTGETINGLTKNLRNINVSDTEMYVQLEFNVDGNSYVIKRGQTGNPKTLALFKNGIDISGKVYTETEAKVLAELPELTKDLIANTIILGQGMPSKFSSFNPSGRKELLEKLTKSDYMIEDIKTRVANRLQELNNSVRAYDDSLLVANSQLAMNAATLDKVTKQIAGAVKPDYQSDIDNIGAQIAKENDVVAELTKQLADKEAELEKANASLLQITSGKADRVTQLNEGYNKKYNEITKEKLSIEAQISALSREIKTLESITDVCPTCHQKIPGRVKPDTAAQKESVAKLTESLESRIKPALADCAAKYNNYMAQINAEFNEFLAKATADVASLKKQSAELKNSIQQHNSTIGSLQTKKTKLEYEQKNYDSWLQGLSDTKASAEAAIGELKNNIQKVADERAEVQKHLAVVKKMETLTKRDFRGYLLANIISYINQTAKDYSKLVFGTEDLDVYIDGNNLDISYCGKMIDNLSGGEKTRVDLILQLAIRNMLKNYLNFNSNIIVLDEITDFLDKTSCKAIMGLIEKELVNIESVFIISHHADELELPVDGVLQVVKDENGISSIR